MKKQIKTSFLFLTIIMVSCSGDGHKQEYVAMQMAQETNLSQFKKDILAMENSLQIVYADALNEIESSLNSITDMRGIIIENTSIEGNFEENKKEKIIKGIQIINSLLVENEKKIDQLKLQVKKANAKNEALNPMIVALEQKLANENEMVMILKGELAKRDFEITDLTARIDELEKETTRLTADYNALYEESRTAYITVGTYKELKQKGIVEKQGGILKVGGVASLSDDFPAGQFQKLNMEDSTMIPVDGKKIDLITEHPSDSYELTKLNNTTFLHITDPDEFWKTSRYLVVQRK
jgi:outer membrane murein-binding lipoprotein Lpp